MHTGVATPLAASARSQGEKRLLLSPRWSLDVGLMLDISASKNSPSSIGALASKAFCHMTGRPGHIYNQRDRACSSIKKAPNRGRIHAAPSGGLFIEVLAWRRLSKVP
jgi:hypothetical protein